MARRTTETAVTFKRSFRLGCLMDALPAGTYRLVIDEETMPGLPFPAYRRVAAVLHVAGGSAGRSHPETFAVDPAELEDALKADANGPQVARRGH